MKPIFILPKNYTIPENNKEKLLIFLEKRFEKHNREMERKKNTGYYTRKFSKEINKYTTF
jgi:hypothetical protein